MKTWKLLPLAASRGLVVLLSACRTGHPSAPGTMTAPAELMQPTYLYEVARHLSRWYLDEDEVGQVAQARQFVFWVRRIESQT